MFEDDFGRFWNLSTRCKWTMLILECDGECKHVEFTQHGGEKFEKNVYFLCMPPLSFQQHGTAETEEDQTMHVAHASQRSWTDSLFPLCFLCGKRS